MQYPAAGWVQQDAQQVWDAQVAAARRVLEKTRVNALVVSGVSEQVWSDFQTLRKAKRSPLTQTAVDGIQREANKAGISLQDALEMACQRGWAGFKADWVKPDTKTEQGYETPYAKSMREKYEKVAPSVAARAPGVRAKPIVFDFEAEDVPSRLLG